MREKFSTVTVGGSTFEVRAHPTCVDVWEMYRQHPDWTIEHDRCDDASCKICDDVFGPKPSKFNKMRVGPSTLGICKGIY